MASVDPGLSALRAVPEQREPDLGSGAGASPFLRDVSVSFAVCQLLYRLTHWALRRYASRLPKQLSASELVDLSTRYVRRSRSAAAFPLTLRRAALCVPHVQCAFDFARHNRRIRRYLRCAQSVPGTCERPILRTLLCGCLFVGFAL
jgi:hypothetical protein